MKAQYLPFYNNLHETEDGRLLFKPYRKQCYIVPKEHEKTVRTLLVHMNILTNTALLIMIVINAWLALAIAVAAQGYYHYRYMQFSSFLTPTDEKISRKQQASSNMEAMAGKISFFGLYGMIFLTLPIFGGLGFFLTTVENDIPANLTGIVLIAASLFSSWKFMQMIGLKRQLKKAAKANNSPQ